MMELKNCPFCGSADIRISEDDGGYARWVTCNDCECDGPLIPYNQALDFTSDEARQYVIDKWNTRPPRTLE